MKLKEDHESEDDSIVYNSTRNYLVLTCAALLLVAGGIVLDCMPLPGLTGCLIKVIATVGIALFGACANYCVRRTLFPSPDLILSNKGFRIDLSAFVSDWYEWQDLAEVNIRWIGGSKNLCITFQEADNPLKRLPSIKKFMMRLNRQMVGSDLTLPCSNLPVTPEKLLSQIQTRLELSRVLVRPVGAPHDAESLLLPYSGWDNGTAPQQLLRASKVSESDIE